MNRIMISKFWPSHHGFDGMNGFPRPEPEAFDFFDPFVAITVQLKCDILDEEKRDETS